MCNHNVARQETGTRLVTAVFETKVYLSPRSISGIHSKFKMATTSSSANDEVDDLFSRFMTEVRRSAHHNTLHSKISSLVIKL